MKNKILLSSIIATVLFGTVSIQLTNSKTSVESAEITQRNGKIRDAKSAVEGGSTTYFNQTESESKAALTNWWEYSLVEGQSVDDGVFSGDSTIDGVAANYNLVTLPEGETEEVNGVETNMYYELGLVVNYENASSKAIANALEDIFATSTFTRNSSSTTWHNKYWEDAASYVDVSTSVNSVAEGANDYYYAKGGDLETKAVPWRPPSYLSSGEHATAQDKYIIAGDLETQISEERWHESFTNDERTLYGANDWNQNAYWIFRFPLIKTWNNYNGVENNYTIDFESPYYTKYSDYPSAEDHFNFVPGYDGFTKSSLSATGGSPYYIFLINGLSVMDQISLQGLTLGKEDSYSLVFESGSDEYTEDGEMLLSAPLPSIKSEKGGFNEDGKYEVDVTFDHTYTSIDQIIVNSIEYELIGPASKDDPTDVTWDYIYIDDQSASRQYRKDESSDLEEVEGFQEKAFAEGWNDGDINNGGEVDTDGTYIGGANDWTPSPYVGDMEIATEELITTTLQYDQLMYEDSSTTDIIEDYTIITTVSVSPTTYGKRLGTLTEADGPTENNQITEVVIDEEASIPTIETFDIKDEDVLELESGTDQPALTFVVSGDTESVSEDLADGGTGMRPTYLKELGVVSDVTLADGTNQFVEMTEVTVDETDGSFEAELTSKAGQLVAVTDYKFSLVAKYGESGEITHTYSGPFSKGVINAHTHGLGDKSVNITGLTATKSEDGIEVSFTYNQSKPTGGEGDESAYDIANIASAKVVNNITNEDSSVTQSDVYIIDDEIISNFDESVLGGTYSFEIPSSELKANSEYKLSLVGKTTKGADFESNVSSAVTTESKGAFAPTVSGFTRVNEQAVGSKVTTDFQFNLTQQTNDDVNISEYSKSNISNISFLVTEDELVEGVEPATTIVEKPSLEIPTEDTSIVTIVDSEYEFNSSTTYNYRITIDYEDGQIVKDGTMNFELSGLSELDVNEDVKFNYIDATKTSMQFGFEITDNEILSGYDSFDVTSIKILDQEGNEIDSTIQIVDGAGKDSVPLTNESGDLLTTFPDRAEGEAFSEFLKVEILNVDQMSEFDNWVVSIDTNSINNSTTSTETFETNYQINLSDSLIADGLIDGTTYEITGSESGEDKPVWLTSTPSLENITINENSLTYNSVSFSATIVDEDDLIAIENGISIWSNGQEFSSTKGNLLIDQDIVDANSGLRIENGSVHTFTLMNLSPSTTYDNFSLTFNVSEKITDINGKEVESKYQSNIDIDDLSFKTLEAPKGNFPWWILILLLITLVGAALFLVWFFLLNNKYKVVETTEVSEGKASFRVNSDEEFSTLINGRELKGTQGGVESILKYTVSGDVITVTGISNDSNISKLVFPADEAANAKALEAFEKDLAKWETAKAKAEEAEQEFTDEKPVKPNLAKDIKLGGSVKSEIKPEVEEDKGSKSSKEDSEKREALEKLTKPKLVKVAATVYDEASVKDYTKPQLVDLIMDEKSITLETIKKIAVTAKVTLVK